MNLILACGLAVVATAPASASEPARSRAPLASAVDFRLEDLPGTTASARTPFRVPLSHPARNVRLGGQLTPPPLNPGGLEAIADKFTFGRKLRVQLDPSLAMDEGGQVNAAMVF
ncbi:MAG: hypothetical protein RQ833_11195 [Sphingomonadaceae bacterium]|nr:hypothetical protein [Sphingomonadaceae bacterium]